MLRCHFISYNNSFSKRDVDSIYLKGSDGIDFVIQVNHMNMFSSFRDVEFKILRLIGNQKKTEYFFSKKGLIKIINNQVFIISFYQVKEIKI